MLDLTVEMKGLSLSDKRLNKRCLNILQTLAKSPRDSIPNACQTHREIKAAYRFFKNPKVSAEKLLSPHIEATIQRCKNQPVVLYIEDTTEEDFTGNSSLQKLGRLDSFHRTGMYSHVALGVTPEGVPVGVLSNMFFSRELEPFSHKRNYRQTSLEEKESYRWVEGIRRASELTKQMPDTKVIYIADRESDTFHCLFEAVKNETKCDILIRACKDRNTSCKIKGSKKKYKRLFSVLEELPVGGELKFRTQAGYGRKSREVTQTIRYGQVELKPWRPTGRDYHNIQINAIMLREKDCPEGAAPINWVLLTTLAVESEEQVKEIIDIYRKRWTIEVFFKFLKEHCKIEDLKLVEASRLEACIALYMIIAWRLLLCQKLAKMYPEEECTLAFTELEWKVIYLYLLKKKKESLDKVPKTAPPLKEVIKVMAMLGGFVNRKGDGEPGPKAICQGFTKMQSLVEGWELCQRVMTYG